MSGKSQAFEVQEAMETVEHVNPLRIVLDVFILVIVFMPYFGSKYIDPYKRGFYCDDDSIYYPFKKSTVSGFNTKLFGTVIPIIIILIVEAYRTFVFDPKVANGPCEPKFSMFGLSCNPFLTRLYFYIGYFLFGAALCLSLTKLGKLTIGRLRPHFISVCQPSFNMSECLGHKYIEEPHCTGDVDQIRDGRLSFPSGHSSYAFYTMMFAIFYIQAQVVWPTVRRLIKPLIQFILLCLAVGTALSRISDYKHHWSDVFAGSIVGIVIASAITFSVMGLFRKPKNRLVLDNDPTLNVRPMQRKADVEIAL